MKTITFNEWKLSSSLPFQSEFSKHMGEGVMVPNLTPWIDAKVPGSIYRDLVNAKFIDDPYYADNSLKCEWVSDRWWVYRTTFNIEENDLQDNIVLSLDGIDYCGNIYVNGTKIARQEGMFIPFSKEINEYIKVGENALVVIIENAPFADPQPGYTSKTRYLKPRYNYKWDFCTRLVNLGLYGDVKLSFYNDARITAKFIRPVKVNENLWNVNIEVEYFGYNDNDDVTLSINLEGENISKTEKFSCPIKKGYNKKCFKFQVSNPKLWWPNGYGEAYLYDYSFTLSDSKKIIDEQSGKIGFRTIEHFYADGREDALPYGIKINGKPIYLKGTNIVPIDCMSGESNKQIDDTINAAKEANINYLRIWGGGKIESERFYEDCDKNGIMILQEFTMSSSGCDDIPSKNYDFIKLLHKAAVEQLKLKRNHVSLTFIDGGNELTDEKYEGEGHPANLEDSTLAMLNGLCHVICPDIMMLPSSGSGPNALLQKGDTGNNHDVHGPWGYMGVVEHYDLYNTSDSIVHGEFGCGGMANYSTIEKCIPEKDRHVYSCDDNYIWLHHSGGWDAYSSRELIMFGDLTAMDLKDYVYISQYMQAESLRYSLEANRRRQWANVGEMTWEFNEPWPNIQCSNVYDYYGDKKLGFYYLKEAYESVLVSLRYNKFFYDKGDNFDARINIINDKTDSKYSISYEIVDLNGKVLQTNSFNGTAFEDKSEYIADISLKLPNDITGGFIVRLSGNVGETAISKEYLMLISDIEKTIEISDNDVLRHKVYRHEDTPKVFTKKCGNPMVVAEYAKKYMDNIK